MTKPFTRRNLIQLAAAGLVSAGLCGVTASLGAEPPARPPGALEEPDFMARCLRCMRCVDVCAPLALRPAGWLDGMKNVGTPIMDTSKCIMCMECIRYCPTGALSKIPKSEVDIGQVVLVKEVCLAWRKTRRCDLCFKACPDKAILMEKKRFPVIVPENCNGCGICVRRCPEPGSLLLVSEGAKRYQPQPERLITRLEDRVGPYDVPPPSYEEWFANRLRNLARQYGLLE